MAQENADRVVVLSPSAVQDFAGNQDYTAHMWGWQQAQRYSDFLEKAMRAAADDPLKGRPIEGHPFALAEFVKWPKARYGHFIVYRPTTEGIYVMRILHSAMDIPEHVGE